MKHAMAFCALAGMLLAAPAAFAAEGDFNGDGAIDQTDQQRLTDAMNTASGDPGFDAACDLDGDGRITLVDLGAFLNLSKQANAN